MLSQDEYTQRAARYVLQERGPRTPYKDLRDVPKVSVDRLRDQVAAYNAKAGYRRYRVVTR